jgi:hypothetical protein
MRKRKIIDKKVKKIIDKKCYFCSCDKYELLDVHRIVEGSQGGKYVDHNSVSCCALCHRKIHAGIIKIDRKYPTSLGQWVLHYWINGEEKWE